MTSRDKKLTVVLIQVPTEGCVRSLLPQLSGDKEWIGFKPPIALLSIATTVRERVAPCSVFVVDAQAQQFSVQQTVEEAMRLCPDVVGISAWTDFWWAAYEIGKRIKAKNENIHICYGGPHVNIYPEETLNIDFVDTVVCGDGETPFSSLCKRIIDNDKYDDISGVYSKKKNNAVFSHYIENELDELPIPDRNFLNLELYNSVLSKNDKITTLITSRGCPNKCIYCKLNFQKPKSRSAQNVIEEFRYIHQLGIKEVEIYDDTFTWSKQRVADICNALISENIQIRWAIRDRVDRADRDLLKLMAKAGCIRVNYGIESGVERILRIMRKGITLKQARNAIAWSKEAGLETLTYFLLGGLDETREEMELSVQFALELDADYSAFSITIPYPGTELYNIALERGILPHDFWKPFAERPEKNFVIPHFIENILPLPELIKIHRNAVRTFYMRPKYIWRQLKRLGSFSELWRKARMGKQILAKTFLK